MPPYLHLQYPLSLCIFFANGNRRTDVHDAIYLRKEKRSARGRTLEASLIARCKLFFFFIYLNFVSAYLKRGSVFFPTARVACVCARGGGLRRAAGPVPAQRWQCSGPEQRRSGTPGTTGERVAVVPQQHPRRSA